MNVRKTADRIEAAAKKLGYSVRSKEAQTGTLYLYCDQVFDHDSLSFKIRVADHQDAYATANYTADDVEGTCQGAIKYLAAKAAEAAAYTPPAPRSEAELATYRAGLDAEAAARESRRAEVQADGQQKTKHGSQYIAGVIGRDEYDAAK